MSVGVKKRLAAALANAKYRRGLTRLPFLFTFANAFLGFVSITQSLEKNYEWAIYSIMLAALMDAFDGRLARALNSTTALGAELDSLADAISFCLAPCVLWYTWYGTAIGYTGYAALAFYLCAGLFRLAKFNLTAVQQQNYFIGLPTPVAAFFVSSLVLYSQWIFAHSLRFVLYKRVPLVLVMVIAWLMISSIRFPTFKHYRRSLHLFHYFIIAFLLIVFSLFFIWGSPILLICITAYIVCALAHWLLLRFRIVK